jgi:hypothetical protein
LVRTAGIETVNQIYDQNYDQTPAARFAELYRNIRLTLLIVPHFCIQVANVLHEIPEDCQRYDLTTRT